MDTIKHQEIQMILEPGQFGIIKIQNTNTKAEREMIMVYKGMDLAGMPTIKAYNDTQYVVDLGYNEQLIVKDRQSAVTLLNIINGIFVAGEDAEQAVDTMIEVIQNVFFQDA